MENNTNKNIKTIVYTSLAIAMVALLTFAIKIPAGNGYVNFGDIFIFTTAALIGKRTALIAGGVGSALSDILSSYVIYSPATLVIKGLEGFVCGLIIRKSTNGKISIVSLVIGGAIGALVMVAGYFFYELIIFGLGTAVSDIVGNLIQGSVSVVVTVPLVLALNNTKIVFDIEK